MKIKFKGLKIEVEEFLMEDTERDDILRGYRNAINQISILAQKENNIEKIQNELKLLYEFPKI